MMEKLPETDIHNHILPGLDDGSPSLEESLFLARKLVEYGFKRVVCTPHSTFLYRNTPATVLPACRMLQDALDEAGVPLRLIPSQEYRLIPETWPQMRRNDWLLPWEGNHLLIELPIRKREQMGDIDMVAEIRQLIKDGYRPVIAHPERYLWAEEDDYRALQDAGAEFQRNLGAVEGIYGSDVAERAKWLLAQGYYTYLATDMHDRRYTTFFDKMLYGGE
ncbi:MAG: hypothetical protein IKR30_02300 [Bacteroidales bacterium]|nr:hypothetical protein [Bacteroidales bacterium]